MKKIIAFLFLFQLSFGQDDPEITYVEYKDSIVETKKFYIGDVNNDELKDYAISVASRNKETNDVIRNSIDVKFSNNNETIGFYPSNGIYITTTEDINKDGSQEIIIFSMTNEGWWNDVSVWSFKKGEWDEVTRTKAFCSDSEDFKNRVKNKNGKYFLVGDDYEFAKKGIIKKIKIRLNSK